MEKTKKKAAVKRIKGRFRESIIAGNNYLGIRRRCCEYCGKPVGRMTRERFEEQYISGFKICNRCGQQVYQGE